MMGRPTLQVNTSEFEKMYHSGASISEVADHFKISVSTVRKIRIRLNIPVRRGRFDEKEYKRLFF
jgi:transposase